MIFVKGHCLVWFGSYTVCVMIFRHGSVMERLRGVILGDHIIVEKLLGAGLGRHFM